MDIIKWTNGQGYTLRADYIELKRIAIILKGMMSKGEIIQAEGELANIKIEIEE